MLDRIGYALGMAWKHRFALRRYLQDPSLHSRCITAVDWHRLKKQGIRVLVLDFDGVLASYGETVLSQQAAGWLSDGLRIFPYEKSIFILSNQPNQARADYFRSHFPKVTFLFAKRKKPYSDGILQVSDLTGVHPNSILMIDDRLLTGILAAVLAGAPALLITHPVINFRKRLWAECFFLALRKIERLLFS